MELELQVVVILMTWVLGAKPGSCVKSACALSH